MSFFDNIFGNEKSTGNSKINWTQLTSLSQLDQIIDDSAEKPALIFKHSTRCSISRMALRNFENRFGLNDKITPYFLDLITYRNISDEIARRFDVVHHSPQLLLIRNGKSIYDVSHDSIDAELLEEKL